MIFGSVHVSGRAVETHRDSYMLAQLTVISVRRPLLLPSLMLAAGGSAFGLAFGDLLYAPEIAGLAGGIVSTLIVGVAIGQIQLLSRDLRGSELSCMIWGSYGHLNRVRREIGDALSQACKDKA